MFKYLCRSTCGLDLSTRNSTIINTNWLKRFFIILMLMIFAVLSSLLKESLIESVFITMGACKLSIFIGLPGLQFLRQTNH